MKTCFWFKMLRRLGIESTMYEPFTSFFSGLQGKEYGRKIIDKENDSSPQHLIQFLFIAYGETIKNLKQPY